MPNFVKVASKSEVSPGEGKVVEAEGKTFALFNVEGTFYALDNTCLHRGGPLGEGQLEGKVVTCPWHAWQWDVTTGVSKMNPETKVANFPVEIRGEEVYVGL